MILAKSFVFAVVAAAVTANSAVIELTEKNFTKVVFESNKPTLVKFFATWCGHCKSLAPVYEELADAFKHKKDAIQIAKVNADVEKKLGGDFKINGFPTLKFFDGKSKDPVDYDGGRDFDSLAAFIKEKVNVLPKRSLQPSNLKLFTGDEFSQTIGDGKYVIVAFTASWCGHCNKLAPIWEAVANDYVGDDNIIIAKFDKDASGAKKVFEDQEVQSFPTIKLFGPGKEGTLYKGSRTQEDILEWINEHADTHRIVGGKLNDIAGTVASLDEIAAKYAEGAKLADVTAKMKEAATNLEDKAQSKYAEYYERVLEKLAKSENHIEDELLRLNGMLSKGSLTQKKQDDFQRKINVLRKYMKKAAHEVDASEGIAEEASKKATEKVKKIKEEL